MLLWSSSIRTTPISLWLVYGDDNRRQPTITDDNLASTDDKVTTTDDNQAATDDKVMVTDDNQAITDDKFLAIVRYLSENGQSRTEDIANHIQLSVSQTKEYIYRLIDAGKVVSYGANRNRTY